MADNQKLFAQMADLGRNISLLTDSVKKNTAATESFVSKSNAEEKNPDTGVSDALKEITKTLKDVQKVLGTKPVQVAQTPPANQKGLPSIPVTPEMASNIKASEPKKSSGFDYSKIAGNIAKTVIKSFQEGGVSPKTGNYLVGENGPEIVALPKGSGVLPLDLKDLMEGIAKVPELSAFLKGGDKVGVYGERGGDVLVSNEGKKINLRKLENLYENKDVDPLKDPTGAKEIDEKLGVIADLWDKSRKLMDDSIGSVDSERSTSFGKLKDYTDSDHKFMQSTWDAILGKMDPADINDYTVAKSHLIATQMLLDKKSKELDKKDEFDKLGKIEEKTKEIVNPKAAEIKKEAEKIKKEEKSEGLLSKIGLKKREKPEEPEDGKEEKGESKASAILNKAGKFAENVAFGVAGKVLGTNLPGVSGAIAQKGLGALKKSVDSGLFSKKENKEGSAESSLMSKVTDKIKGVSPAEKKESIASLDKTKPVENSPNALSKMTSSVKKLETANKPKQESKKEAEAPVPTGVTKESESKKPSTESKSTKSEPAQSKSESPLGNDKDIQDIKNALSRIASILEGPLTVSPMDSPFRPDSRRI